MIDVSMTYIHTLSTEWPEWAYSGHPNKCAAYFNDLIWWISCIKVSFLGLCSKMQIIPIKKLNIKKVVPQFLWFFRLKCWFKGQIISRIHLSLPNAYKPMCFDRNININSHFKFLIGIIGHCTGVRNSLTGFIKISNLKVASNLDTSYYFL